MTAINLRHLNVAIFGLLAMAIAWDLGHGNFQAPIFMAVFVGTGVALVFLHELGHLLFGRLAGVRVASVTVGRGKVVLQKRVGGIWWRVRAFPFGGHVVALPPAAQSFVRTRLFLLMLGGPLVDASVAFVAWRLCVTQTGFKAVLAGASALMAAAQLVADLLSGRDKDTGVPCDGLAMAKLPSMSSAQLDAQLAASCRLAGTDLLSVGDRAGALRLFEEGLTLCPQDSALLHLRSQLLAVQTRIPEAKKSLEPLLSSAKDPERINALAYWSWFAYLGQDERDLRTADRRSAAAFAQLPDDPVVARIRGAVLLWKGNVVEALPLLQRSRWESGSEAFNVSLLLAMAQAALGNAAEARQCLGEAQARRPDKSVAAVEPLVVGLGELPHTIRAARGSRMVLIHADRMDLGGPGRSVSVAFTEIAELNVGLTARGRAELAVRHGGRWWRVPLDPDSCWIARLAVVSARALHSRRAGAIVMGDSQDGADVDA